MGTQAVDLVDKIAGEEKHTEEDIGREGRHVLLPPLLPDPCLPLPHPLPDPHLLRSLHLIIVELVQTIKSLQTCYGPRYWGSGVSGHGHHWGSGLPGHGHGDQGERYWVLENILRVIKQLDSYVGYLLPGHHNDHRHHQHHDDQYDVVHDTSYLPPSNTRPAHVPRYDGKITTTTDRNPAYIDSYGK